MDMVRSNRGMEMIFEEKHKTLKVVEIVTERISDKLEIELRTENRK